MTTATKLHLVDDHAMLRNGLATLLRKFGYEVVGESNNGKEFIQAVDAKNLPDVVLLDINMPEMDGYQTMLWLREHYPMVKVLALSMYDDEAAIIRMIRSGAKGYILKEAEADELKAALQNILTKGFHYSDTVTGRFVHSIQHLDEEGNEIRRLLNLTEKEIEFLKWCATELTYKEIATKMGISPRSVDSYREILFDKLQCKSRIGLVMFGVRNKIVPVD